MPQNYHELPKFEAQHIPQKEFLYPQDYRPVSKAEMESILNALMN